LEGSAAEYMVAVLVDGVEVWQVDTRVSPILKSETTDQAVEAVRNAIDLSEKNEDSNEAVENQLVSGAAAEVQ
jgi:hypothetical protein